MRLPLRAAAALGVLALATAPGRAQDDDPTSVESSGAVVVHDVSTGALAARLKAADRALDAGDLDGVVASLDELAALDLNVLHEDSEGVYLRAEDAVLYRLATLPPDALAAWRKLHDPRGAALFVQAAQPGGGAALERGARTLAMTSHGPRLLVLLSDRRRLHGDLRGAARVLEDLLILWPAAVELPGVERAAVVSRLAALMSALDSESALDPLASQDGAAALRALAAAQPGDVLAAPSPALAGSSDGATLADELAAAARAAARRTTTAEIPRGKLRVVAEHILSGQSLSLPLPDRGREIVAQPAATVSAPDGRPLLLTRVEDALGISSRLLALRAPADPESHKLEIAWGWPGEEEGMRFPRPSGASPFRPVLVGDLVLFAWPSMREAWHDGERHTFAADDELRDLVMLSLSAEGKVVDERGPDEDRRDDGDPALARLSFCGPPLVVNDAVFVTLSGRSPNGGASELHVARFDIVRHGADARLLLRWRRHVVDGSPVRPAQFAVTRHETERPLAFPTGLAERFGLLYVGSNTGAVACLEGTTGAVIWLETYQRFGSTRRAIAEADPVGWKYGPVRVDGNRVVVAPRDSESLLVFAARPLRSRTMRLDEIAVRGSGTATRAGSPLGELHVDELVGVRDGYAVLSGALPRSVTGAIRWPPSPVVALRLREPREGEPTSPLRIPEIPELTAAGAPTLVGDALLFPTYKALYGVTLDDGQGKTSELWRATSRPRSRTLPDRLGNVLVAGRHIWSVTSSRIVLFATK